MIELRRALRQANRFRDLAFVGQRRKIFGVEGNEVRLYPVGAARFRPSTRAAFSRRRPELPGIVHRWRRGKRSTGEPKKNHQRLHNCYLILFHASPSVYSRSTFRALRNGSGGENVGAAPFDISKPAAARWDDSRILPYGERLQLPIAVAFLSRNPDLTAKVTLEG